MFGLGGEFMEKGVGKLVYFCSFYLWKRKENEKLLDSDGYGLSE